MRRSCPVVRSIVISIFAFIASNTAGPPQAEAGPGPAAAEADSIAATIRRLSVNEAEGKLRSRFCFREAELLDAAEWLSARLEQITGEVPSLEPFEFVRNFGDGDTTFTSYNIKVDMDLSPSSERCIALTAHYDAIASRTPGFYNDWENMASPGANDNASGVAVLLETARLLAGTELPYDVRLILFSGEELGRLGSIDYVERCDALPGCPESFIGVVNLDMLGYSGDGGGMSIMSDEYSGWLAYALEEAAGLLEPSLDVVVIRPGPWNWDHASFWEKSGVPISAVTVAEPLGEAGAIIYPYYHSIADTLGMVDLTQVAAIGSVLEGFISGGAGETPEFTMYDTDIVFYAGGARRPLRDFSEGESMTAVVKVRNTGGTPSGSEQVWLEVETESSSAGVRSLFGGYVTVPDALQSEDVIIALEGPDAEPGGHLVRAGISVSGSENRTGNDSAVTSYSVSGDSGWLIDHGIRPNPVRGGFDDARLCLELEAEAEIRVEVLSLEGDLIAETRLGRSYGDPLDAGFTCLRCGDIFDGVDELASGIYIYRIRQLGAGGRGPDQHGRFAVVN